MKNVSLGLSLLAGLGVLMTACGDNGSGNSCPSGEVACVDDEDGCIPEADATLAWVQVNVFEAHGCASSNVCHNGQNPNSLEDLDLTSAQASLVSLVDAESAQASLAILVEPGDSDSSYLMNKLRGENIAGGTFLMPQGAQDPLCAAKLDGVRAWIDAGANP